MPYDQNLFRLASHAIADGTSTSPNVKLPSIYTLQSQVDNIATMVAAGYISNAKQMGAKVGDVVDLVYFGVTPPIHARTVVATINATTGAGDLSDATVLSSTNAT